MYTPVTEEGSKGEPQYAITDYVKAGCRKTVRMFVLSLLLTEQFYFQNNIHLLKELGAYHVKLLRLKQPQQLWY